MKDSRFAFCRDEVDNTIAMIQWTVKSGSGIEVIGTSMNDIFDRPDESAFRCQFDHVLITV